MSWHIWVNEGFITVCVFQPLFAFELKEDYGLDGWTVYDPETEFRRQVFTRNSEIIYMYL